MKILKNDWAHLLEEEFAKHYYLQLRQSLKEEYDKKEVYPEMHDIFNALQYTSYQATRVVVLGQDPYHGTGQAHGLSFSVKPDIKVPPSLQNIFKELQADLGYGIPNNGYLVKWAEQGVLLLNTILTVRKGTPNSHKGMGWESFTDKVISILNDREKPVIFILWGKNAQEKQKLITSSHHFIIKAPHPSPFSAHRGFFGSKPFSQVNQLLKEMGSTEIDWHIPSM